MHFYWLWSVTFLKQLFILFWLKLFDHLPQKCKCLKTVCLLQKQFWSVFWSVALKIKLIKMLFLRFDCFYQFLSVAFLRQLFKKPIKIIIETDQSFLIIRLKKHNWSRTVLCVLTVFFISCIFEATVQNLEKKLFDQLTKKWNWSKTILISFLISCLKN